jgi:predicted permease
MRIPVLRGRTLAESDDARSTPVAVINETMARSLWKGEDALGRRFRVLGDSVPVWITVVGITRDVRTWGIAGQVRAEYTLAHKQMPAIVGSGRRGMWVVVRSSGNPIDLAGPVRREIAGLDPELAISNLRTMDQVVSDSLSRPRFTMLLLAFFGGTALILAAVGVYGVLAYGVAQRAREIGIRLALGAEPRRVRGQIVGEGLALAVAGLGIGIALALGGSRLLASQLYGIEPTDPPTYLAISLLLLGVAFLATWQPARRATRADPLGALRAE